MNLSELKSLLTAYSDRHFRIALPGGGAVPVSFHVTEVGRVRKTFLACGLPAIGGTSSCCGSSGGC
jgi:hypothetical protein